jgi:hypothetical protein
MSNWVQLGCELLEDWKHPQGSGLRHIYAEHLGAEKNSSYKFFIDDYAMSAENHDSYDWPLSSRVLRVAKALLPLAQQSAAVGAG